MRRGREDPGVKQQTAFLSQVQPACTDSLVPKPSLHPMRLLRPSQVARARVLIPTTGLVTAEDIAAAPHLRLITQPAAGYNNIAVHAAKERGIPVCTAPGGRSLAVPARAESADY